MASLPKHLTATPTLIFADIHLTVDGGDIRGTAMQGIYEAIEQAFSKTAEKYGLDQCIARRLRSTDSRRLRRTLRHRGFPIALEPATAVVAVDPQDGGTPA